jgi:hypothetical protein
MNALDITILGKDGTPKDFVSIGVDEHWRLVQRAKPKELFPLISRLDDYYEDASFGASELAILKAELSRLDRNGLESTIDDLIAIISSAEASGKGLEAIAD